MLGVFLSPSTGRKRGRARGKASDWARGTPVSAREQLTRVPGPAAKAEGIWASHTCPKLSSKGVPKLTLTKKGAGLEDSSEQPCLPSLLPGFLLVGATVAMGGGGEGGCSVRGHPEGEQIKGLLLSCREQLVHSLRPEVG